MLGDKKMKKVYCDICEKYIVKKNIIAHKKNEKHLKELGKKNNEDFLLIAKKYAKRKEIKEVSRYVEMMGDRIKEDKAYYELAKMSLKSKDGVDTLKYLNKIKTEIIGIGLVLN